MAQKYQCTICGYIYDPEKGDPDSKLLQEPPLQICRRHGPARSVAPLRMILKR